MWTVRCMSAATRRKPETVAPRPRVPCDVDPRRVAASAARLSERSGCDGGGAPPRTPHAPALPGRVAARAIHFAHPEKLMSHLFTRLCLAALACTATIACEDEGPDTTTADTDSSGASEGTGADGSTGDDTTTAEPGTASAASTIAPPPGDDSDGDGDATTGTTGEEPGPTTIGPPKDLPVRDLN